MFPAIALARASGMESVQPDTCGVIRASSLLPIEPFIPVVAGFATTK